MITPASVATPRSAAAPTALRPVPPPATMMLEIVTHQESAGNRHTIEESMKEKTDQRRGTGDRADRVRFLAEMEMRSQGVLGEMDGEIPGEHQQRRHATAARERL